MKVPKIDEVLHTMHRWKVRGKLAGKLDFKLKLPSYTSKADSARSEPMVNFTEIVNGVGHDVEAWQQRYASAYEVEERTQKLSHPHEKLPEEHNLDLDHPNRTDVGQSGGLAEPSPPRLSYYGQHLFANLTAEMSDLGTWNVSRSSAHTNAAIESRSRSSSVEADGNKQPWGGRGAGVRPRARWVWPGLV